MRINRSLSVTLCRVSAFALFAVSSSVLLSAQQSTMIAEVHQPALFNFTGLDTSSSSTSLNLAADSGLGYSSSVGSDSTITPDSLNFLSKADDADQPPPRRRYGRPNYSDRMHNADGSSKLAFLAGAGFTNPVGDSTNYLKISWKFQVGAGYNFNKKFGIIAQFDWDNFALPGKVLASQSSVYDNYFGATGSVPGLDGHTHDWSLTVNPTYNLHQGETIGTYAVVGAGFYHKVTDFTLPTTGTYCDYYYGCYQYTANQTFDQYTSNSFGINGGIGFTYKPSRFGNEKFYAEARYVHGFNKFRPQNFVASNLYQGNSDSTDYLPITVGVRF